MSNDWDWNINLPEGCPPESAHVCNGIFFYRIVEEEVSEHDFVCNRTRRQEKDYSNQLCIASGISIDKDLNAIKKTVELPALRDEYNNPRVARIELLEDDGKVNQTGNRPTHYTFWRTEYFDFQNTIEIIE
mgnify:CR=1 FL=1